MPRFVYQALNASLEPIAGELQADGVAAAVAELETRGLVAQSIRLASLDPLPTLPEQFKAGAASTQLRDDYDPRVAEGVLQAQLTTLLQRGRTLTPALRAYLEEMPEGRERRELSAVCNLIDSGDASAARQGLAALPECWIPLLSAAASSGDAGRVIRDFLKKSREAEELRWQRWRTLAYPVIVALIALTVMLVLSSAVLPIFAAMFDDFNLQLPWLTSLTLAMGRFMTSWEFLALGVLALVVATLAALNYLPGLEYLRVSPLGRWFGRSTGVAQFTRYAAELISAGVDRANAVRIAAHSTRHRATQLAAWNLAGAIDDGAVAPSWRSRPVPATATYALQATMSPAARVQLLSEISGCYSDRARRRLSWTRGLIGPAAIMVIGIGVGMVVLSLFLPLVSLVNNLI